MLKKKYIGSKDFYKNMLAIMLPVLTQNVVTNFVSMLDNIMVGRIGTEQMSGVAIVNQLLFVFNLCIFGGIAGAGIFTAQFYGKGDSEGVKNTMRAKAWIGGFICAACFAAFIAFGEELLMLFIHEGEDDINLEHTLGYGMQYLRIIMIQIPLFAAINVYASTFRETGNTRLPMIASLAAVGVNLFFNYVLIYGKLGAPKLGVEGAAYATLIARVVELSMLLVKSKGCFTGVWSTLHVPRELALDITKKGFPLLINELLWSSGMTTLVQIMSLRGIEVVSAQNICDTFSNLFFCSFFAMGSTITIMVGHLLGAGKLEEAVDTDNKLIFFSVMFSATVGVVMIFISPYVPEIYNTTETVKLLATRFFLMAAMFMPSNAFIHSCYFTLRSGGKVFITILYDSVYLWVLAVPLVWGLVNYTNMEISNVYFISYVVDIVKVAFGYILVHRKKWVKNLVSEI